MCIANSPTLDLNISKERERAGRCRENVAHITRTRPDYGLGFQAKVLKTFQVFPSSFARGWLGLDAIEGSGISEQDLGFGVEC